MDTMVQVLLRQPAAAQGDTPARVRQAAAEALRPGRPEVVRWHEESHTAPAGHPVRRLRRYSGISAGASGGLRCVWHAGGHLVRCGNRETDYMLDHYLALDYALYGPATATADDEFSRFVAVVGPSLVLWEPWIHDPVRGQCYPWRPAIGYLTMTLAPEDGGPEAIPHRNVDR